jgi:hypothetical protein
MKTAHSYILQQTDICFVGTERNSCEGEKREAMYLVMAVEKEMRDL